MNLLKGFDANEHIDDNDGDFKAMPAGWYVAKIIGSQEKQTKLKNGNYLSLTFEITEGTHSGRLVWTNLNLENKNPDTVNIAKSQLSKILRSCGFVSVDLSDELHGIEIKIKLSVKAANENFPEGNDIKNYASLDDVQKPKNIKKEGTTEKNQEKKKSRVSF